jgi:hypothetical protein
MQSESFGLIRVEEVLEALNPDPKLISQGNLP